MPTTSEKVVNRALSGTEAKQLILEDCQRLVDAEGLLSSHAAFGRVAWTIQLTLHTSNVYFPATPTIVTGGQPGERLPLDDAPDDASLGQTTLHREVTSPNEERVRVGMGVPVETRGQDGTRQIELVQYPPQPELGEGDITITDTTPAAKQSILKEPA